MHPKRGADRRYVPAGLAQVELVCPQYLGGWVRARRNEVTTRRWTAGVK